MCLGVPGRVVAVDGMLATCDFWGVRKQVRLDVIDEPVGPGDYLLNHVGYAIRRFPADDIAETLALYDELLADVRGEADPDSDLMAADIRGELSAAAAPAPRSSDD